MNEQALQTTDGKQDFELETVDAVSRDLTLAEIDAAWEAITSTKFGKRFNRQKFEARKQFGRLMGKEVTPELLGVNVMESAEIIMDAIRNAASLLDEDSKATVDQKLAAVTAVTLGGRAVGDLSDKAAKLYCRYKEESVQSRVQSMVRNIGPSSDRPIIVAQNVQIGPKNEARNGPKPIIVEDI